MDFDRRRCFIPGIVIALFFLALLGSSAPSGLVGSAHAAGSTASSPPRLLHDVDNDGDDDDLKYQWQDPAHSTEEINQMLGASALLVFASVAGIFRARRIKELSR